MEFEKQNDLTQGLSDFSFSDASVVPQSKNALLQNALELKKSIGGSTMNQKFFRKFYNVIALDPALRGSALKLYLVLNAIADLKTRQVIIFIKKLAEKAGISPRHVRRSLATLIELGLVERILRKSPHDNRMNIASIFIVHDIDTERYGGSFDVSSQVCQNSQHLLTNMSVPTDKDGRQKIKEGFEKDSSKENNNNFNENISQEERTVKAFESVEHVYEAEEKNTDKINDSVNVFKYVPDVFLGTVDYLLKNTGRTKLYDSELGILRTLSHETELPRVKKLLEKLTDEAVERFTRKGKSLKNVTINYLAKALEGQLHSKKAQTDSQEKDSQTQKKSLKSSKNTAIKKTETKQFDTEPEIKPELTMSVEEAEKVIDDYAQSKKQSESLPTALLELFEKIQLKHQECADKSEQITLEDYLHLSFPEAENEELHRDYYGNIHENYDDFPRGQLLEDAFKIDYACAVCNDPNNCKLPTRYRHYKKNRPVAKMTISEDSGKKFLEAYNSKGCIKCKYGIDEKTREKCEFEDRVKHSGLSTIYINKTFDTFDHQNAAPDAIVAKAQAILAVKNKSNLILAGKPGTGKTHLASVIALETMKNGHQAIFKSLPEFLDQICFAYQNNTDPYGFMLKFKTVPCLVLDDWGKEKTTDARLDYLFQIIDYRYRNGLQTIITTNAFDMEGLKNRWNADKIEPLVSRILENGQWVTIYASENYRLKNFSKPETQTSQEAQETAVPEVRSAVATFDETDKAENFPDTEPETDIVIDSPEAESQDCKKLSDEPRRISEVFSNVPASAEAEKKPEKKSWQEISESAEYKAMSEADKIKKQWEFFRETPDYEKLSLSDKVAVQRYFVKRIEEANKFVTQFSQQTTEQVSHVINNVPQHNDDLNL